MIKLFKIDILDLVFGNVKDEEENDNKQTPKENICIDTENEQDQLGVPH